MKHYKNKIIYLIFLISISFIFFGCSKISIKIIGDSVLYTGESRALLIQPEKLSNKVEWESNDSNIVIVNKGIVFAIAPGEATVRAYLNGQEATITITVIIPEGASEMVKEIDNFLRDFFPAEASKRIVLPYSGDIKIRQSLVYPNAVTKLRPGTGKEGLKMPGGVKYVVIHDTGMSGAQYNAAGINHYIHEQANSPTGRVASWHYTVGEDGVYQHVPDDEIAWHAGDGSRPYGSTYYNETYQFEAIGGGNQNGIGIETCINTGGDYQLVLRKTAKLVASLLIKYDLEIDAVKQHYNFSGKNCPYVIRTSGLWEAFLKEIEFQRLLFNIDAPVSFTWEIDKPEIIDYNGKVIRGFINDETVNIKMNLNISGYRPTLIYPVKALGLNDRERIDALYQHLKDNIIPQTITESIELPAYSELYDVNITWESNRPECFSDTGGYIKPTQSTWVTLTLTLSFNETTAHRQILVVVK
ncbi:MAG: N-acetylmuramoyl-L-alanine amidase [Bacilli bacterium]|nr:N-acetylmuramoyl-L-alanine amidase [Bacilli bacterium]MDD4078040.1 N-acetylmuramoyl-L-alanine amidase [Bacilli bacterium]